MFWFWKLKENLITYLIALADKRTPFMGKLFAVLSIVYLLSPVDVLLDTIPFAGFIDDLFIVPLGVWISSKNIPKNVLLDAEEQAKKYKGKLNVIAGFILSFILIWILIAFILLFLLIKVTFL